MASIKWTCKQLILLLIYKVTYYIMTFKSKYVIEKHKLFKSLFHICLVLGIHILICESDNVQITNISRKYFTSYILYSCLVVYDLIGIYSIPYTKVWNLAYWYRYKHGYVWYELQHWHDKAFNWKGHRPRGWHKHMALV
jgi:hypothetical protein